MKEKLFADVAQVLVRTQTVFPEKVTPAKARLLLEVSDILYMAWQVSQAAEPATVRAWQRHWQEVVQAQMTIESVAHGQKPSTKAVSRAANLCIRVFKVIRTQ